MNFSSSFGLNNFDGRDGFAIETVDGEGIGYSVDIAGDINGDGIDDLIIGAPSASPNGDLSGKSYVVFGSATRGDATVKLSDLDGSNGFVINGADASTRDGDVSSHAKLITNLSPNPTSISSTCFLRAFQLS